MRKQSIGLDEIPPPRRSRGYPQAVVAVVLATSGLPFVYEGILVCVGNWRSALGRTSDVRTPVLDLTFYYLGRLRDDLSGLILPWFQHVPWQPSHVLIFAGVAMIISMIMLKR